MRSQMDHSLYFAARGSLVRRRYTFAKLLSSMRKILASSSLVQLRVTVNLSSRRLWRENHDRKWNESAFEFNYILEPIFSPLDAWIGSSPVAVGIAHSPVCWFWTDRGGQKNVTICHHLHSKGHNYAEFTFASFCYKNQENDLVLHLFGSGDTDAVIPLTSTRYSIDALGLPTTTSCYPWYDHKQVRFNNPLKLAFLMRTSWVIDGRFWTVVRRLSYPNRSRILYPKGWQLTLCLMFLLLWLVLNRLAGGVKCTRAWPWWPFVVQGMRSLSTDRDRHSYCFSTSCRGRPCRKMEPPHN